jgi:hypothetical protein
LLFFFPLNELAQSTQSRQKRLWLFAIFWPPY